MRNHRRLQYNGKGGADWVIWPSGGARRRDWALSAEWVGLVLRWGLEGVDLGSAWSGSAGFREGVGVDIARSSPLHFSPL